MLKRGNDVAGVWLGDGRCFVVSAYSEADAHAPGGHAAAVSR